MKIAVYISRNMCICLSLNLIGKANRDLGNQLITVMQQNGLAHVSILHFFFYIENKTKEFKQSQAIKPKKNTTKIMRMSFAPVFGCLCAANTRILLVYDFNLNDSTTTIVTPYSLFIYLWQRQ